MSNFRGLLITNRFLFFCFFFFQSKFLIYYSNIRFRLYKRLKVLNVVEKNTIEIYKDVDFS